VALLASPDSRAAARTGSAPAGDGGCTVLATVLAGGGVAKMVALLRAALGGGGRSLRASSARKLLAAINTFNGLDPAAAASARAAGALPLAARAIVAAQRTPGPDAKALLAEAVLLTAVLAAPGDLPALAAQPDLVAALAGAVALAADGASEDWSAIEVARLGKCACVCVAQLITGGQGSSDAAASGFLAAGGAAHVVRGWRACRRSPGARVGPWACNATCTHAARARCRALVGPTA
jgi:hypothetical protein